MIQPQARQRHLIHNGRLEMRMTVISRLRPTMVIAHQQDNIRPICRGNRDSTQGCQKGKKVHAKGNLAASSLARFLVLNIIYLDMSGLSGVIFIRDHRFSCSYSLGKYETVRGLTSELIEPMVRRMAKNPKGELTEADYAKVTEINFSNKGIVNLKILSKFKSVNNITLTENAITNLKPIAKLDQLESLQLQSNHIKDLKPLSGLIQLERLNLSKNNITNIGPLKKLINLQRLNLINNNISDLSAVSDMKELRWLGLNFNKVNNIEPLVGLKKLKVVMLTNNVGLDYSDVEELRELLPNCMIECN